jgi:hypothetical protein
MPAQAWVTLVLGLIGFGGVIAGIVQRTQADKRAEWWRRATWAVDHTLSDDEDAQIIGFDVLGKLQASHLISRQDRDLFMAWGTPQALADDNTEDQADNQVEEQ